MRGIIYFLVGTKKITTENLQTKQISSGVAALNELKLKVDQCLITVSPTPNQAINEPSQPMAYKSGFY